MPLTKLFITTPPQYNREEKLSASNVTYEVGDRINFGANLYVCSTAGLADSALYYQKFTGAATVTWGTSVWTLTASTSFATAGIYFPTATQAPNVVVYVDFLTKHRIGAHAEVTCVFVHPETMEPHPPSIPGVIDSDTGMYKTFYGTIAHCGYNAKATLNSRTLSTGIKIGARASGVSVPAGTYPLVGCDISGDTQVVGSIGISDRGNVFRLGGGTGVATMEAPLNHIGNGALSSTSTVPYASVDSTIYGAPTITGAVSDTANYRDGAAPAGGVPFAYRITDDTYGGIGRKQRTGRLSVQNRLTGARTVTVHLLTDSPYAGDDIWNTHLWMDVWYLGGTNGAMTYATTEDANIGLESATQTLVATDTATWTRNTTLYPTVTALKLTKTVTITEPGQLHISIGYWSHRCKVFTIFFCPFFEVV